MTSPLIQHQQNVILDILAEVLGAFQEGRMVHAQINRKPDIHEFRDPGGPSTWVKMGPDKVTITIEVHE